MNPEERKEMGEAGANPEKNYKDVQSDIGTYDVTLRKALE